jgi:hypothetical protein
MGVGLVHVETLPDNEGRKKPKDRTSPPRPNTSFLKEVFDIICQEV